QAEVGARTGRGARIVTGAGEPVAWWGEDLPFETSRRFEFDVTNLYVIATRNVPPLRVEVFERIPNRAASLEEFHGADDWIVGLKFHGGFLRQQPSTERFLIEKRPDSSLWLDVTTRSRAEVLDATRNTGLTATAVLVALACLVMLVSHRRSAALVVVFVAIARIALAAIHVNDDPLHIFRFDFYGSRILGPFSRSPFDLMLTALAVLVIMIRIVPREGRPWSRLPLAILATAGFVDLARNLVDNSRISPFPEHIVPINTAQGVLLGALLMFAFAILRLTWHSAPKIRSLVVAGVVLAAVVLGAYSVLPATGAAFLIAAAAVIVMTLVCAIVRDPPGRVIAMALLAVPIVFGPVQMFERVAEKRFVSESYAPLVVGESVQLCTMIANTLADELSRTELSTILPDDYRHMNLDDLAYALWLNSDLSKWRVPAVITIADEFTRRPISRFGVGLPQFEDRADQVGREVLQVGALRRDLIHHDFELTVWGTTIATGSVHVVNPADPGATSYADVYRDFFEAEPDPTAELHPQTEPAVYDHDGNPESTVNVRLPKNPAWYFARLVAGSGLWVDGPTEETEFYLRKTQNAIYAFPLQRATFQEQVQRAGSVGIWALALVIVIGSWWWMPRLIGFVQSLPRGINFRARTSLYIAGVVILPLIVFVLFVRAYLANRLEAEYVNRGTTALTAAQRVIEDYLASQQGGAPPEQVLDDEILSWLARVVGHDLHLYRGESLVASSRRDLFAAHIESQRLPGDVYSRIILGGQQMVRAQRASGAAQFVEIYSPVNLERGSNFILALPFIVQGRQIEEEVNDVATMIYMVLIFVALAAVVVAFRIARGVMRPVQELVAGARGVAQGNFDVDVRVPNDPEIGLLVTTFRDMARSIKRQQEDLRRERDRLQTLLENINAAVVVLDGQLHVAGTNVAGRKLLDDDVEPLHEFIATHQPRRSQSEELELSVGGKLRTYRVSIVPLHDSDEEMLI
ncbi:MAG TPA: HAMP domain-containing protein, partial [Thermoanaerobaculia bacterium]|nr:HAMP domain-containing protein [Thermoanaerobaculia bacterium]